MLIILFIISLILLALGVVHSYFDHKKDRWSRTDNYWGWYISGGILLGLVCMAFLICGVEYSNIIVIDEKIALYEEENAEIEGEIATIVENYMNYEQETFKELKPEATDVMVLINAYPELKSDAMVTKQIDLYTSNQSEIKRLKTNRLDYRVLAWWLYFGGGE